MTQRERRQGHKEVDMEQLKAQLSPQQRATLVAMEQFRWTLQFVRRPLFQPAIPVVFDRARQRHAVVELDGRINEQPGFSIRA